MKRKLGNSLTLKNTINNKKIIYIGKKWYGTAFYITEDYCEYTEHDTEKVENVEEEGDE